MCVCLYIDWFLFFFSKLFYVAWTRSPCVYLGTLFYFFCTIVFSRFCCSNKYVRLDPVEFRASCCCCWFYQEFTTTRLGLTQIHRHPRFGIEKYIYCNYFWLYITGFASLDSTSERVFRYDGGGEGGFFPWAGRLKKRVSLFWTQGKNGPNKQRNRRGKPDLWSSSSSRWTLLQASMPQYLVL